MDTLADFGFIVEEPRRVMYKKSLSVNNTVGRNDAILAIITPEIVDRLIPFIDDAKYWYSILITVGNHLIGRSDDWVIDMIKSYFKRKHKVEVYIIPDYSEGGRLHFHGLMKLTGSTYKYISKLKNELQKDIGLTWIRPIRGLSNYVKYMFKFYTSTPDIRFDIRDEIGNDYLRKLFSLSIV